MTDTPTTETETADQSSIDTDVIHCGDTFDVLPTLPAESVHAVVADPPYGLAFMGRSWDEFEPKEYQQWSERWARAAKRVLKPGGHLLAFSGNRTHHRLFTGVEDAGFEIRDTLTWHYGTGFPKGTDVSKTIDKQQGAFEDREVIGKKPYTNEDITGGNYNHEDAAEKARVRRDITAPATAEAAQWEGWSTQLKPASEFVVLARKPLAEESVAENVLEHGTGALNIDGCRIDTAGESDEGRYPANILLDAEAAAMLDGQAGPCPTHGVDFADATDNNKQSKYGEFSGGADRDQSYVYADDHDGASRFFYCAKATKAERTHDGTLDNDHPTVKPLDVMEWLITLVTAPGQLVLDPFVGSGTTCLAAKHASRKFVGVELQAKYADIARARCGLAPENHAHVRGDDDQTGLDTFAAADTTDN